MYICITTLLFQVNNDAGGGAGDAAEGGGAGENANNAQEAPEEEDNNGANQDVENGAHNGDGTYMYQQRFKLTAEKHFWVAMWIWHSRNIDYSKDAVVC